jgi:hypothetical protein
VKWLRNSVALLVALAIGTTIGWFLGRTEPGAKIERLGTELRAEHDKLEEARQRWQLTDSDLDDQIAEKEKWKAKTKELRPRLEASRLRKRQLSPLRRALAPNTGTLAWAQLVKGPAHDLLIVAWRVSRIGPHLLPRSGLEIWRLSDAWPLDQDDSVATTWQMIYSIEPRPTRDDSGTLIAGPPGSRIDLPSYSSTAFIADVGDVTHDGMPDLAIQDWGTGTGGCGVIRVLDNAPSGLREIFNRDDCDHHIYIKAGSIGYRTAYSPPRCRPAAHGCGWERSWMRWNGSSWETTKVRRKVY